jgi:hypothetical protein
VNNHVTASTFLRARLQEHGRIAYRAAMIEAKQPHNYLQRFPCGHKRELGRRFQPPELAVLKVGLLVILVIQEHLAGIVVPTTAIKIKKTIACDDTVECAPQQQAEDLLPIEHDVVGQQHLGAWTRLQQQHVLLQNEATNVA